MGRHRSDFDYEGIMLTDWARFASFLDGEGSIIITYGKNPSRPRGYHQLQLRVVNSDPRLLKWLRDTFGGYANPCGQTGKLSSRPTYYWAAGTAHAEELLRRCYPFLILKREQADVALAFRETFGVWSTRRQPESVEQGRSNMKKKLEGIRKSVPTYESVFTEGKES